MRVDSRHAQSAAVGPEAGRCVSHQLVSDEGIDVGILQASRKSMAERLGCRDFRHAALANDLHKLLAQPIVLQGTKISPNRLRGNG